MKKAAYVAVGTGSDGKEDVLGIWLGATESSKYWLSVLNGLKRRGVQGILIASVDGLSGFVEAINVVFPKTKVQRCMIPSDPFFYTVHSLQGHQAVHGGFEADLQSADQGYCSSALGGFKAK